MLAHKLDEETLGQMLDELTDLVYDHLAKLRKDQTLPPAIESGSFKERTGS